jgi:hypothetical protein
MVYIKKKLVFDLKLCWQIFPMLNPHVIERIFAKAAYPWNLKIQLTSSTSSTINMII